MTERLTPPDISPGIKLYGPPTYFPSIEKTYGQPIQHWIDLAAERLAARLPPHGGRGAIQVGVRHGAWPRQCRGRLG